MTEWFPCNTGVRQGDNLSPTLFALFINDLAIQIKSLRKGIQIQHGSDTDYRHITDISLLLYADDIALIAGTESDMQTILDLVTEWCNNWNLQVNINKSKVMHFRKRKMKQSPVTFQLGNNALDYVPSYKYLGVIFDENRDFKTNTENLAKSGGRALGSIISKIHHLKDIGFDTYEILFHNCVTPIIDYCSGVWGHQISHKIDMVQDRAIRYFLGVHRMTPLLAVRGECGWTTSSVRHKTNMVRLWNRLLAMDDDRITKKVFLWDRSLCGERS